MATLKDYLQLHFLVVLWGFTAILGKLISIPPVELVFYRTAITLAGVGCWIYFARKSFRIDFKTGLFIFGIGIIVGIHWLLFFLSARVSTASVCLAGLATSSFWTSFIEPMVVKRKISVLEVVLGVLVVMGLLIIFRFEVGHALGLFLGVLSALAQAIFSTFNGQFTKRIDPLLITFYEMAGAFAGIILFFPFYSYFFTDGVLDLNPTFMDWIYLLVLALVCTVYAYSKAIDLMKRITAFALNLTINLEPIYGMLLAYFIIGGNERMTTGFYLGAGVILSCVIGYPLVKFLGSKSYIFNKIIKQ